MNYQAITHARPKACTKHSAEIGNGKHFGSKRIMEFGGYHWYHTTGLHDDGT